MVSKSFSWLLVLGVSLSPLAALAATADSQFTVAEPEEVPGMALQPGSYSIHIVDHLSERYVVRVDNPKAGTHTTFLATENHALGKTGATGQVLWTNAADGKQYLRGWIFRGEPAVLEFVYPKADAVAIAKTNEAKVPAIDPASEGRPAEISGLTKNDLELVNLWLLSSTHVGPGDTAPTIQAEHYRQVASMQKPKIGKLPQTASSLPLIALLGAMSMVAALGLRLFSPAKD